MGIFYKPILARGEAVRRAGSGGSLASGATTIPITNANSYFTTGQPVFVMDDDNDHVSWCGKVQSASSANIVVAYPVTSTYTAHNAVVPSKYVYFNCDYVSQEADIQTGVVNFESNASEIFRTQIKGEKEIMTINWAGLDDATWLAWRLFLQDANGLNWGINDIMLAFHNPQFDVINVTQIRVLNERFPFKTVKTGLKSLSLRFIALATIYV